MTKFIGAIAFIFCVTFVGMAIGFYGYPLQLETYIINSKILPF